MGAVRRIACLIAHEVAAGQEQKVERDLLEVALAHSPRVELGGSRLVYLDMAGLEGLFGDERQIGQRLVRAAVVRGLPVRVGVAGSRLAARVAACRGDGVTVIAPGADAAYLASTPLAFLNLSDEWATRLGRWGIRTLGELAALPAAGVFERLGSDGVRLQHVARGEDSRPLDAWELPAVFEESIELGWAMETLEPLGDLLTRLAGLVCEKLTRRGLSADQFEWSCRLTDGTTHDGSSTPAVPMNEAPAVALLLKAALASRPPRGPVEAVTLRARPVRVAAAQESLVDRSRPSPRMLAATLARLAALVGEQQVGTPVCLDSYRPDAVSLAPPALSPRAPSSKPAGHGGERVARPATLALRRFRPPFPASVTLTSGRPIHLRCDRLTGRIVASVGPWRSSGEWWTERPWMHDEWDVELADGTLCRLAHDGSAWWLEGIYD
jgi:protein ImuB